MVAQHQQLAVHGLVGILLSTRRVIIWFEWNTSYIGLDLYRNESAHEPIVAEAPSLIPDSGVCARQSAV